MQYLQPNTTLQGGKYRIERVLGQGGFGITYLAIQVSLDRKVAIKELFIGGSGQAINDRRGNQVVVTNSANQQSFNQHKEKFKKEALRLANLNHPNLVKVHDFFEENETAYYVMEYIDGESLRTKLNREGCFSEKLALKYLKQILPALEAAHKQSIWHLDIKPENIMVDRYGHAYLIDFGASKHVEPNSTLTTSLALAYTPGFCPPELLDLSNETPEYYMQAIKDIGPWTDIYALGATIYNLLTDSIPPSKRRLEKEGRNAFMFPSNISSSTKDMIVLMMKPNLEDRPQSVKEIIVFFNDKALYELNDNIPILMSEDNQTHPKPNFIIIDKNEPNKQEKTLYDTNKELLMSFNINDITINYDIVDPNLFYKFFNIYNNQLQSNERIYIEDIVRKTKNSIEIILVNIGWWLKGGMVKNIYVKQTMTHISAEVAGFSAGDVYSALSLAERALTFAGIVKGANISPAKVLLGIGWLLREGKVHLANNRIGL
jgi:serine/threonine protein kinase